MATDPIARSMLHSNGTVGTLEVHRNGTYSTPGKTYAKVKVKVPQYAIYTGSGYIQVDNNNNVISTNLHAGNGISIDENGGISIGTNAVVAELSNLTQVWSDGKATVYTATSSLSAAYMASQIMDGAEGYVVFQGIYPGEMYMSVDVYNAGGEETVGATTGVITLSNGVYSNDILTVNITGTNVLLYEGEIMTKIPAPSIVALTNITSVSTDAYNGMKIETFTATTSMTRSSLQTYLNEGKRYMFDVQGVSDLPYFMLDINGNVNSPVSKTPCASIALNVDHNGISNNVVTVTVTMTDKSEATITLISPTLK